MKTVTGRRRVPLRSLGYPFLAGPGTTLEMRTWCRL